MIIHALNSKVLAARLDWLARCGVENASLRFLHLSTKRLLCLLYINYTNLTELCMATVMVPILLRCAPTTMIASKVEVKCSKCLGAFACRSLCQPLSTCSIGRHLNPAATAHLIIACGCIFPGSGLLVASGRSS